MSRVKLVFNPNESINTTESTLSILPYFSTLFESYKTRGLSKGSYELFIDVDIDRFRSIMKILYHPSADIANDITNHLKDELSVFLQNYAEESDYHGLADGKSIIIDVGGKLFQSTAKTLSQCEYFEAFLARWQFTPDVPIFIDRDPDAFAHILSMLRNHHYKLPNTVSIAEHEEECTYYMVPKRIINGFLGRPKKDLAEAYDMKVIHPLYSCRFGNMISFNIPHAYMSNLYIEFEVPDVLDYNWYNPKDLAYNIINKLDIEFNNGEYFRVERDLLYILTLMYDVTNYDLFYGTGYLMVPLNCLSNIITDKLLRCYDVKIHLSLNYISDICSDKLDHPDPRLKIRLLYKSETVRGNNNGLNYNFSENRLDINKSFPNWKRIGHYTVVDANTAICGASYSSNEQIDKIIFVVQPDNSPETIANYNYIDGLEISKMVEEFQYRDRVSTEISIKSSADCTKRNECLLNGDDSHLLRSDLDDKSKCISQIVLQSRYQINKSCIYEYIPKDPPIIPNSNRFSTANHMDLTRLTITFSKPARCVVKYWTVYSDKPMSIIRR